MSKRLWEPDDSKLMMLAMNGLNILAIAKELDRTRAACEKRLYKLDIEFVGTGMPKTFRQDTVPPKPDAAMPNHKNGRRVNYAN